MYTTGKFYPTKNIAQNLEQQFVTVNRTIKISILVQILHI